MAERWLRRTLLAASLTLAATGLSAEQQTQRMSFAIMRNGMQIGQHDIIISSDGGTTTVEFQTLIEVKVMFIKAYGFAYVGREVWADKNFTSFRSQTDDNGTMRIVSASAGPDKVTIAADGKQVEAPKGAIPASFWNLEFVNRTDFFDTETGRPLKIKVTDLGEERISTRMGSKLARHYRLRGGLDRDLWFDRSGAPLRYQLRGSDNSTITSEALQ